MDDLKTSQQEGTVFETMFGPREASQAPLDDFTTHYLYKQIWTREALTVRERSMITLAVLTALGRDRELKRHLEGALNIGLSPERIDEILLHVAHYAGWPAGHNAGCISHEQYGQPATARQLERLKDSCVNVASGLTRGEAASLLAERAE